MEESCVQANMRPFPNVVLMLGRRQNNIGEMLRVFWGAPVIQYVLGS